MNLLSGTTWKGSKLRIGEAKPDFRERYVTSYFYRASLIHPFVPTPTVSNARTRSLQMTDQPKGVAWDETFRGCTPMICPSSLLKTLLHDPVGTSHPWVGSFAQCECGQGNLFRPRPPLTPRRERRMREKNGNERRRSLSGRGGGLLIRQSGIHNI